jgi:hypothetical protein
MKKKQASHAAAFDWWDQNVTSEIYINTDRSDWWECCDALGEIIKDAHSLIDIGGGDGHTLWQILSVAFGKGAKIQEVSFVDPSPIALKRARKRLEQFSLQSLKLYQGTLEKIGPRLLARAKKPYDMLFAGHANYYFGKQVGGKKSKTTYEKALQMLPKLGQTVIIMTAPRDSDYYRVVSKNPFGDYVYSEAVAELYRSRGYRVRIVKTPMKFYVAHAHQSKHEAIVLWKFFNDTERMPSHAELHHFLRQLSSTEDLKGTINIKDQLVIVTKK